jgi:ATP synthase mitochondrial F1 complex assembly factor 1
MATSRVPALRHLISCQPLSLRASNQRRWAAVHDVRFLATTQHRRAVVEKYREKLNKKARQEGLRDFEELKAAYADKISDQRKRDAVSPSFPDPESSLNQAPSSASAPTQSASQSRPETSASKTQARSTQPDIATKLPVKPLSEILDLPKARALPDKELAAIWRLRHATSPTSLCAVIPATTYSAMESAARENPSFILPVPHPGHGAEIHFLQWTFDPPTRTSTVLFTQLAEFKSRGEFALPHTTITHHTDLIDERGLVLMQGRVDDGRGVRPEHAQWLVMCLQRFYGGMDGEATGERAAERRRLLKWFASGDERFSVEKLMEEAERLV